MPDPLLNKDPIPCKTFLECPAFKDYDAIKAEVLEYRNTITWETTCKGCAKLLDSCYAETVRAETAEKALAEANAKLRAHDAK